MDSMNVYQEEAYSVEWKAWMAVKVSTNDSNVAEMDVTLAYMCHPQNTVLNYIKGSCNIPLFWMYTPALKFADNTLTYIFVEENKIFWLKFAS